MKEFKDKVAVVTGGASGIGRAVAERLGAEGMKIVVADVEQGALDTAVAELASSGITAIGVATDVSDWKQVERLAERTVAEYGAVHVICNNAGVGGEGGPTWELPGETWEWVIGVNLWGVINGVRAFVPLMLKQGGEGHVVNIASMAGFLSTPLLGPYCATKHAVVALSESLHHELAAGGVPVKASVVCPGFVKTGIMDSKRNRPARLQTPERPQSQAEALMEQVFRQSVEAGLAPEAVADRIVAAIRSETFYVFPHPEALEVYGQYSGRVTKQQNPVFDPGRFGAEGE